MNNVYKCKSGHFYSAGVTRVFGENRMIKTKDLDDVFASVQPLMCDPKENGLEIVGTINNEVK